MNVIIPRHLQHDQHAADGSVLTQERLLLTLAALSPVLLELVLLFKRVERDLVV